MNSNPEPAKQRQHENNALAFGTGCGMFGTAIATHFGPHAWVACAVVGAVYGLCALWKDSRV